MNIAVLQSGTCVNACLFADLQTAQDFLAAGVWPDADNVLELPDGYGIGDSYDVATGAWTKVAAPEPEEPVPSAEQRIAALETTNRQQAAKIAAQTQSITMLEDCIAEMAGVVYA